MHKLMRLSVHRALVFVLLSFLLVGCATGVDRVKLYDPLKYDPTKDAASSVAYASVPPERTLVAEKIPLILGRVRDNRPDIASIGVKKNGWGMIMGKVDVEEQVNFVDLFTQ
jgi:hypothetical protein